MQLVITSCSSQRSLTVRIAWPEFQGFFALLPGTKRSVDSSLMCCLSLSHTHSVSLTLCLCLFSYASRSDPPILQAHNNTDIILRLPMGKRIKDIRWLSVWCRRFTVSPSSLPVLLQCALSLYIFFLLLLLLYSASFLS